MYAPTDDSSTIEKVQYFDTLTVKTIIENQKHYSDEKSKLEN